MGININIQINDYINLYYENDNIEYIYFIYKYKNNNRCNNNSIHIKEIPLIKIQDYIGINMEKYNDFLLKDFNKCKSNLEKYVIGNSPVKIFQPTICLCANCKNMIILNNKYECQQKYTNCLFYIGVDNIFYLYDQNNINNHKNKTNDLYIRKSLFYYLSEFIISNNNINNSILPINIKNLYLYDGNNYYLYEENKKTNGILCVKNGDNYSQTTILLKNSLQPQIVETNDNPYKLYYMSIYNKFYPYNNNNINKLPYNDDKLYKKEGDKYIDTIFVISKNTKINMASPTINNHYDIQYYGKDKCFHYIIDIDKYEPDGIQLYTNKTPIPIDLNLKINYPYDLLYCGIDNQYHIYNWIEIKKCNPSNKNLYYMNFTLSSFEISDSPAFTSNSPIIYSFYELWFRGRDNVMHIMDFNNYDYSDPQLFVQRNGKIIPVPLRLNIYKK